jgi:hypothetical protein
MSNRLALIKQLKAIGASIKLQDDVANYFGGNYDHPLYLPTVEFIVKLHMYFQEHMLNKQRLNEVVQSQSKGAEIPSTYDAEKFKGIDLNAAKQAIEGPNFAQELKAGALEYINTIISQKQEQEQELSGQEEELMERDKKKRNKSRKKGEKAIQKSGLIALLSKGIQNIAEMLQGQQQEMAAERAQNQQQSQSRTQNVQQQVQVNTQAQNQQQNQQKQNNQSQEKPEKSSSQRRNQFSKIRQDVARKCTEACKKVLNACKKQLAEDSKADGKKADTKQDKREDKSKKDTKDTAKDLNASKQIDEAKKAKEEKKDTSQNLAPKELFADKKAAKPVENKAAEEDKDKKLRLTESLKDVNAAQKAKLDQALKTIESMGIKDAKPADSKAAKDTLEMQKKMLSDQAAKQGRH